jgi:putative nucleotidyltransferase with HDIG domain
MRLKSLCHALSAALVIVASISTFLLTTIFLLKMICCVVILLSTLWLLIWITDDWLTRMMEAGAISEQRLQTTHPNSFAEDPTRLIRALVMNSRYGFQPDERTRQEMKQHSSRLPLESDDAKQGILEKLFSSDNPARGIRLAHDTGLLQHIFPEVETHWDYDQSNPHHNYTLGEHQLHVLENVAQQSNDPDLRVAALLHDIGKPASRWDDPETGIAHYYRGPNGEGDDHATVGATMAEERLRKLRWPVSRIKRISHIIEHHMFPAFSSAKGARKFLHRVGDDHADDLLTLRWADQHGKGQTPAELSARTSVDHTAWSCRGCEVRTGNLRASLRLQSMETISSALGREAWTGYRSDSTSPDR